MKKIGLALAFSICCIGYSIGQGLTINELYYHAPEIQSSGIIRIKTDKAPHSPQECNVKAWISCFPFRVSYVSGTVPRVSAKFKKPTSNENSEEGCEIPDNNTLYARGEVYINNILRFKLPSKVLTASCEYLPTNFQDPNTGADAGFEKYLVQYIPEIKIKWKYTSNPQDENSWMDAGESINRMYLVHQTPITGSPGKGEETSFYLTSIDISCNSALGKGRNGSGNPVPDEVASTIYDAFRGRCVKKFGSNNCMMYWGPNAPNCLDISDLLLFEDASCDEWASFYNDMLRIHGLTSSVVVVVYQDYQDNRGVLNSVSEIFLNLDVELFFGDEAPKVSYNMLGNKIQSAIYVKNWMFNSSDRFYRDLDFEDPSTITVPYAPGMTASIHGAEIDGLPAQGITNPHSIFTNHAIVSYHNSSGQTEYYDPSYGTPVSGSYANANAWESASMAGYGTVIKYKKIPVQEEYEVMWVFEREADNQTTQQTTFHD